VDSGFPGCNAALLGEWFVMLQMNVFVSLTFTIHGPLTMGTNYPAMQLHIPQQWNPELYSCETLKNSTIFVTAVCEKNTK
jgi:hypothetical protein